MKEKIVNSYGEGILSRSAIRLRDGDAIIEQILTANKYNHILEIGTFRGATSALMSRYCQRLTTIDLRAGWIESAGGSFDRHGFWKGLGITNINFIIVQSDEEKARIIRELDFDFAFIDGDHSRRSAANDFEMVKKCGTVLFHDYDGKNEVSQFVNSLPANEISVMDIFALWTADKARANAATATSGA